MDPFEELSEEDKEAVRLGRKIIAERKKHKFIYLLETIIVIALFFIVCCFVHL